MQLLASRPLEAYSAEVVHECLSVTRHQVHVIFSRSCIFQLDDLRLQTLMCLPEQCIGQKMLILPYVASL